MTDLVQNCSIKFHLDIDETFEASGSPSVTITLLDTINEQSIEFEISDQTSPMSVVTTDYGTNGFMVYYVPTGGTDCEIIFYNDQMIFRDVHEGEIKYREFDNVDVGQINRIEYSSNGILLTSLEVSNYPSFDTLIDGVLPIDNNLEIDVFGEPVVIGQYFDIEFVLNENNYSIIRIFIGVGQSQALHRIWSRR